MNTLSNTKLARESSQIVNGDLYEVKCYKNGELDKEFSLSAEDLPEPDQFVSEIVLRADLIFRQLTDDEREALNIETEEN